MGVVAGDESWICAVSTVTDAMLGSLVGVANTAAATACGGADEAITAQPPIVAATDSATIKLLTPRRCPALRLFVLVILMIVLAEK